MTKICPPFRISIVFLSPFRVSSSREQAVPGNTKNRESIRSWLIRMRFLHPWAARGLLFSVWITKWSELSQQKSVTRFPPDVWQAFFCRSFGAPIPKILAHAHSRTLCSCKMCIDPLCDHVLTCKRHTGSIRGHNHLMDVVASLSRDSKIAPVRVNHKVSTTGDGTRKQGDVEISNFRDGLVIDFSFVCEFKGSSRAPGG